jgi:predicted DNA-binding protein
MKKITMTRTQVLLEPNQLEILNRIASEEGKSISALLREWIDLVLEQRRDQALASAAEQMLNTYYANGELVGYGSLDGEEFQGRVGA